MSFTMQPFLVFLGSFPSFILRRACLILNTVPPLMSPCGSLYAVKCRLHSSWRSLPHSLRSPSLRMSSSLAALCSPPRSLLLSVVDWGGDRGETALAPQRHMADCTKGWENLFSLSTFYLNITLLDKSSFLQVIPLKIVSGFTEFFWASLTKLIRQCYLFSLWMNRFIHLRRLCVVF